MLLDKCIQLLWNLNHLIQATELVELLLLRHPQERKLDRLEKELLTISGKASIHVLTVFLSRKLSLRNHPEIIMVRFYQQSQSFWCAGLYLRAWCLLALDIIIGRE